MFEDNSKTGQESIWKKIQDFFGRKPQLVINVAGNTPNTSIQKPIMSGVMQFQTAGALSGTQIMDLQTKKMVEKRERIKNIKLPFALRHLNFSSKNRLAFYDQMGTLVSSGVPLIDALSLIQAQERNKNIKKLYAQMIHNINVGLSLAESMEFFPHIFPKMQSALIAAAEASGNLKEVLNDLVIEMESSLDFHKKVTSAMVYPVILIFLALILVAGMMIFVIPKIAAMYEQADVSLPALTQTVIDISDFVQAKWPILLMGIFGGSLILYLFFAKVVIGRLMWEKIVSVIPVAGKISKEKNIMLISANMAMLMKSGVLITEAFSITKNTVRNLHYQKGLEKIRQGVVMGREVSQMMGLEDIRAQKFKESPLFPLQMAQLIHIGESTGNIALMFEKIKNNYHKSIEYTLRNISTLIEPIMIFFVAALVGSILMAVMLPFFYIGTTIS